MTDREMWARIEAACAQLDRIREGVQRGVRKVLLPAALGTGLAFSAGACGEPRSVMVDSGALADSVGAPVAPVYAAPHAGDATIEPPPQMDYAAPFPEPVPADLGVDGIEPPLESLYAAPYPELTVEAGALDAAVDGPPTGGRYGTPFP
jgi:hypothetical protein